MQAAGVENIIARIEREMKHGDKLRALALAVEENRQLRNARLEERIVYWRREAFDAVRTQPRLDWPPQVPNYFPDHKGNVPEITPDALSPDLLASVLQYHGCVLVRGLASRSDSDKLRSGLERVFAARDTFARTGNAADLAPWYVRYNRAGDNTIARKFAEDAHGVWTADSPRMLFEIAELYNHNGLIQTISSYLGERPAISIGKSVLRRTPPDAGSGWHQDGAFLRIETRTVNVWLSLSDCGRDAPSIELIPGYFDQLVESGTDNAALNWIVGDGVAERLAAKYGSVIPVFQPGDALIFDQRILHRTAITPSMTQTRWAIETWFFAPSTYPMERVPLVV